jgi:hypothetical protein
LIFGISILYNGNTLNNERIVNMQNKNYVDFSQNISPFDFAHEMYKNTAEDGTLYLNNWYDVDCEDCLTYNNYVANIKWTAEAVEYEISAYNQLLKEIDVISDHLEELECMDVIATEILPDELVATYSIFVEPFESKNQHELKAEVVGRVSEGPCGYELIRHAQRLCRLLSLEAPKIVVQNEERMLFASLVIHEFGEKIEQVY